MIPVKKIAEVLPKSITNRVKNIPFFSRLLGRFSLLGSQAGQDLWIYGEAFNEQKNGFFVDIGAHDGINLSNTYVLESRYQWKGVCLEANPRTFKKLKLNRKVICDNSCIDSTEGEVEFLLDGSRGGILINDKDQSSVRERKDSVIRLKTISLEILFEKHAVPEIIDYLSMDVEGAEERLLADFDFESYMFRTMTIERPSRNLKSILKRNDYLLIKEIPNFDCFYIHKSFKSQYKKNLFQFYADKKISIDWK